MHPRPRNAAAALALAAITLAATTVPAHAGPDIIGTLIDDLPATGSITIVYPDPATLDPPTYSATFEALGWGCSMSPDHGARPYLEVTCIATDLPITEHSGWGCHAMTVEAALGPTAKLKASVACDPHFGPTVTATTPPLKGATVGSASATPLMHGVDRVVCRASPVDTAPEALPPYTVKCTLT